MYYVFKKKNGKATVVKELWRGRPTTAVAVKKWGHHRSLVFDTRSQ